MKPVTALLPFSWLYESGVFLRNLFFDLRLFRTELVDVPVISVGNITTGGTGKTPVVELVARTLEGMNIRAAIVSRGYGRKTKGLREVSDGSGIKATVLEAGDEAFQLAVRLPRIPVVVDERRVRGARYAVTKLKANAIILDDGFQHRALHRDLDIVLVDVSQSPFLTAMLPAGFRREPLRSLRRADAVILTKLASTVNVDRIGEQIRFLSKARIMTSSSRVSSFRRAKTKFSVDLNSVHGKHAVAFCGIARPESFKQSLEGIGIHVDSMMAFDDHHWYSTGDLQRIVTEQEKWKAEFIITTEKDFVRISAPEFFEKFPFFYIELEADIHQKDEWRELLGSVMKKKSSG